MTEDTSGFPADSPYGHDPRSSRQPMRPPPRFNDPMSWSVAIMRLGGVTVRLHAVLLATILVILFRSAWFTGDAAGLLQPVPALVLVLLLVSTVLFEELLVSWVTRWLGGSAVEVVLHPLGGLDATVPPPGWLRQVIASSAGLVGMLVLVAISGVLLASLTGGEMGWPAINPLTLDGHYQAEMHDSWWVLGLHLLQWCGMLVLIANLLPTPPMRGWLILHGLLRARFGWTRARRLALQMAVLLLVGLAVLGILERSILVLLFVLFSAMFIHEEFMMLRATWAALGHDDEERAALQAESMIDQEEAATTEAMRRARSRAQESVKAREEEELDRILEKISREGKGSLDRAERRLLRKATRRRRKD